MCCRLFVASDMTRDASLECIASVCAYPTGDFSRVVMKRQTLCIQVKEQKRWKALHVG